MFLQICALKETPVASAITLEGIDQAISNLNYKNKNTLKFRYFQHIRQYYTINILGFRCVVY